MLWYIGITALFLLLFMLSAIFFIPLTLLFVIAYVIVIAVHTKKSASLKGKGQITKGSKIIFHGNGDSFPKLGKRIYFYSDNSSISIYGTKDKKRIEIPKENITSFYMIGALTANTSIAGGGPSVGGAIAGGTLFGAVGAVVGGRKKVKTITNIKDTRKLMLKFKDNGEEKGLIFTKPDLIWEKLCFMCPEKKIDI